VHVHYYYDGANRRIATSDSNGSVTINVWDGWNLIEERTSGDGLIYSYIDGAGMDEKVRRTGGSTTLWYYQDGRGNTTHLADDTGTLSERYTYDLAGTVRVYDPNGNIRTAGSFYANRFLFHGRDYSSDLGLYDYRNRFYHPGLGRFLQPDPTGFAGDSSNLYRHCGGDPVNNVDPTGEYYRLHFNGGNNYTIEIPIHYTGGTAEQRASFNAGIRGLSNDYGAYHVDFVVTTPTWFQRMFFQSNEVTVRQGFNENGFGSESRDSATWWAGGGRGPDGKADTPEFGAAHSVWHFLGFIDLYDLSTGALKPGVDPSHIMGGRLGSHPTDEMVELVIKANGRYVSVPGALGLNFSGGRIWFGQNANGGVIYNSGSGWLSIGGASYDVRWQQYSGTGNWQADQATKAAELGGGWAFNSCEGSHSVPFDLN
jgi:RHS repeat-associated protein